MLLNETFSYQIGTIKTKNGNNMRVAYIDSHRSQDTYSIRHKLKSYGAKWEPNGRWWYWILGNNPEEVIQKQVKPCIEYLTQIEDMGGEPKRNVEEVINTLITKIKNASVPSNVRNASTKEDIIFNLEKFKEDLVNITSDEEFKRMMEPIIKFRNANGGSFSILNTILILVQDPEATMVKSTTNWKAVNKTIKKGAKPIMLWFPKGKREYTPDEQDLIKKDFLRKKNVKTVEELTPGDKEKLKKELNRTVAETFDLGPYWFDYRFTEQIPGTEDLVGSPDNDIQWFDDSGDETPELTSKIDAVISVIEDEGIKINYVDNLGGARGVSKSGVIEVLKEQPKNAGMLNTIIHEFAHEILHQSYLKNKNEEMKDYFVGTKDGRGKVEQQAELCAWIVMRGFGYDMKTNINYVGIWGLNQDNAVKVFDSVSKVATFISQKITQKENEKINMAESKNYIKENNIPSGYEIAKLVGCGDIYKKSALKQKNSTLQMTESDLHRIIKETVNKIIKEDYVDVFDSEYYELIPLFEIFKKGYCFGSDRNELLMTPLCDKNGNEIGYCLNDLQIIYQPYK
jgi:hypothetical protein